METSSDQPQKVSDWHAIWSGLLSPPTSDLRQCFPFKKKENGAQFSSSLTQWYCLYRKRQATLCNIIKKNCYSFVLLLLLFSFNKCSTHATWFPALSTTINVRNLPSCPYRASLAPASSSGIISPSYSAITSPRSTLRLAKVHIPAPLGSLGTACN